MLIQTNKTNANAEKVNNGVNDNNDAAGDTIVK